MAEKYLVNGISSNEISAQDRGLHYGDGLFETIAVVNKKLLCWDEHIKRLVKGCEKLNIPTPDKKVLENEALSLLDNKEKAVVKIIITRGTGGRGYKIPENIKPARIVFISSWPDHVNKYSNTGINVRVCEYRYAKNSRLAGIKHLNRLEQIIARSEWNEEDITEGLVLDHDEHVIEGTMSNLFCISGNKLYTPDLTHSGIDGVIRSKIIDLSRELNFEIEIKNITLEFLLDMDEVFMCNSIMGVRPVKKIEDKKFDTHKKTDTIIKTLEEHEIIPL